MPLGYIIFSSLLGGLFSVLGAAVVLTVSAAAVDKALPRLVSFSTGALLGAALLGMLPHAADTLNAPKVFFIVLIGILVFFLFEKMLVWRHCHRADCSVHAASGPLLLLGDAFHNFVDGIVIAGAFAESDALGFAAALSTVAHEVPQEIGEFMVYLRAGYSRKKALVLNSLTSLTTVVGAILGSFFLTEIRGVGPYLLAFAAAGFIYVSLADLVPAQRGKSTMGQTIVDFVFMIGGISITALIAHQH